MVAGDRIRAERRNRGLTRTQLAKMLGVTAQGVCRWENGVIEPSDDMKIKLHDMFGIPYSAYRMI